MDIRLKTDDAGFTLRAAALILQNGRLLVIQNDCTGCCYTIGRGVQLGESTEEAILRECREETGIDWQIDHLVFVQERFFTAGGKAHHKVVFFYLMKPCTVPISHDQPTDQTNERLDWLPLDQLKTAPLLPSFLKDTLFQLPQTVQHIVAHE